MDGPGRLALAQSLGKGQPPWSDTLPVMPQEGCECGQPQTQKQLPKSSRCVKPLAAQHAPPPRVTRYLPPFTPSAPDRPQPRTCPVPHSTRASGGGGLVADRRGSVGSRMAYGPGGSPPLPTPTRLSGPRVEVGCGIADSPPAQVLLSLRGPGHCHGAPCCAPLQPCPRREDSSGVPMFAASHSSATWPEASEAALEDVKSMEWLGATS